MIALILAVLLTTPGDRASPCLFSDVARSYRVVHNAEWAGMTPSDVNHLTTWRMRKVEVDTSSASDNVQYWRVNEAECTLLLRFENDSGTGATLESINYIAYFDSLADAETARTLFISLLKPGGLPTVDKETFAFKWRDVNSKVIYDLALRLGSERDRWRLAVALSHAPAQPEALDYLPFERGYMGCAVSRPK